MELSRLTEQIVEFDDHLSEAEIVTMKWIAAIKEDVDWYITKRHYSQEQLCD